MSSDTADLAVEAVSDGGRLNPPNYPQAKRLMIEADGGGHDPAGTSQWNPIEHRLFSQMTAIWAGDVLSTLLVLLGWIRRTTTQTGLKVTATHFYKQYHTGLKVTQSEVKAIQITRSDICPQWNYTIRPRPKDTE